MILLKPLVNEKSMSLLKQNLYTFAVSKDASKDLIKKVVEEKFKVKVLEVNTVKLQPKVKSQRTRRGHFTTSGIRKAIVKLKKGDKIALFEESVAPTEEVEVRTAEGESMGTVQEKKSLLGRTKVRIEKADNKEAADIKADPKRPTKVSQKPVKKGAKSS